MRVYAIGDIHGQLAKLDAAHAADPGRPGADGRRGGPPLSISATSSTGGPDSRGVIDYLLRGIAEGEPWRVLKGNHDRMFADFVEEAKQDTRLRAGLTYLHPNIGGLSDPRLPTACTGAF